MTCWYARGRDAPRRAESAKRWFSRWPRFRCWLPTWHDDMGSIFGWISRRRRFRGKSTKSIFCIIHGSCCLLFCVGFTCSIHVLVRVTTCFYAAPNFCAQNHTISGQKQSRNLVSLGMNFHCAWRPVAIPSVRRWPQLARSRAIKQYWSYNTQLSQDTDELCRVTRLLLLETAVMSLRNDLQQHHHLPLPCVARCNAKYTDIFCCLLDASNNYVKL